MTDDLLQRAIAFHGHYCPGLLIGYRASLIALRELNIERAADEELVTITETDACGVDAIQFITGCTVGKGNLIMRDWGKQVFTFGRRDDGRMLRVALRYGVLNGDQDHGLSDDERRMRMRERLETMSDEEAYDVHWVDAPLPSPANTFRSVQCARCGEGVMEARVRLRDGEPLCPACYGPVYTRQG